MTGKTITCQPQENNNKIFESPNGEAISGMTTMTGYKHSAPGLIGTIQNNIKAIGTLLQASLESSKTISTLRP